MKIEYIEAAIEAILFASGAPVSIEKLSEILEIDVKTLGSIVSGFMDKYNGRAGGLYILKLENSLQLCTREQFAEYVKRALDNRRNTPLSNAAMEVLAIIAYNQPITKAYVDQVRGVDSSAVIANLIEKGLLEEKGKLDAPGRPILYGTTADFLRCFGLSSLSALPPVGDLHNKDSEMDMLSVDGFGSQQATMGE